MCICHDTCVRVRGQFIDVNSPTVGFKTERRSQACGATALCGEPLDSGVQESLLQHAQSPCLMGEEVELLCSLDLLLCLGIVTEGQVPVRAL